MEQALAAPSVLAFNAERHEYRIDGRRIPNVTNIISFLSDYLNVPDDVLQRKADMGEAVHLAADLDDEGDLDDSSLPEEIRGYVEGWRRFRRDTGWVTEVSEHRVYSSAFGYAGALDNIGHFERLAKIRPTVTCLLDKKITFKIMPSVGAQTAAYAQAWNETNKPKVTRRFIVQLKADGTYRLHECADVTDWSIFLSALTLMNAKARYNLEIA